MPERDEHTELAERLLTRFPDSWSPSCKDVVDTVAAALRLQSKKRDAYVKESFAILTEAEQEIADLRREMERLQKLDDVSAKAHNANLAEIAALKTTLADQHDENCDTRDIMLPGKPCNCYVLLKAKLDHADRYNADSMYERDALRREVERLKAMIERLMERIK